MLLIPSFARAVQGLSACPAGLHTYDIIVCAYPLRGYPKNLIMDNKTPVRIFEGCGVFNQLYDVDKVKDKTTTAEFQNRREDVTV